MNVPPDPSVVFQREGSVARIRFNRPHALNAVDASLAQAFRAACRSIEKDPAVRVVILSGEGRAFMAGGDIAQFRERPQSISSSLIEPMHEGLLILTNDTAFAERLTNPEYKVPKTYLVKASKPLSDEHLERLRQGVHLRDGMTQPAIVKRLNTNKFEITVTEGRNRQVRRMVEALDAKVLKLVRVAIGRIRIGNLPIGKSRHLTAEELKGLRTED